MDNKLKIISFNCHSLRSNASVVQELLSKCNILCLQETLIDHNNNSILEQINDHFNSAYVPAYRKDDCFVGRASGGLAIYWMQGGNVQCIPVTYENNRIMGLRIVVDGFNTILLLNVYFTCDYGTIDSHLEYKSTLADLSNILQSENFSDVCITGDMNADPYKSNRFFRDLNEFTVENRFHITDVNSLPVDSYTYVSSNAACSTSFLDHVVCSNPGIVVNHNIMYGSTVYDHIPISFDLILPLTCDLKYNIINDRKLPDRINWAVVTDGEKSDFADTLDNLCLEIFHEVLLCNEANCQNESHKIDIGMLYAELLDSIFIASSSLPSGNNRHHNQVVGWNYYCKTLHAIARENFLNWHRGGKLRNSPEFDEMKISRAVFRNALRFYKNNEKNIKNENLLRNFEGNNNRSKFWKEVSKINNKSGGKITQIDGESDPGKIVDIFDNIYKNILDDSTCQINNDLNGRNRNTTGRGINYIFIKDIEAAIFDLNTGLGWDGIHSNHLKFAGPVFRNILGKLFNLMLSHSYIPVPMIYGEIRPVIKNNSLGKTKSDNYRPVMNSGMFLKTFEYCILTEMQRKLKLSTRQFGFRQHTGCLPAIALVKEIIFKYNDENSSVYCAMVDLSKAFDRVNWNILFSKLRESNLRPEIINIIKVMYDRSYVHTMVNGTKSCSWKLGNGVRQGGILSPLLFAYYMNDTLDCIASMPDGCFLAEYKANIFCFADDIILMAPSSSGLQRMIDKLMEKMSNLCLKINPNKSQYIVFECKGSKIGSTPFVYLNGNQLTRTNKCKYLGVILTHNGNINDDVDRVLNSFLRQFNGMYSKFYFTDKRILYHLFKTFTSSFYGIDVWFEKITLAQLSKISVAYHKAVKKICGFDVWDSNHVACDVVGVKNFKHLLATRLLCFWKKMSESKSPCISVLNYYFKFKSKIYDKLQRMFQEHYSVDILRNPICALKSRIAFVQRNEPRSYYAGARV